MLDEITGVTCFEISLSSASGPSSDGRRGGIFLAGPRGCDADPIGHGPFCRATWAICDPRPAVRPLHIQKEEEWSGVEEEGVSRLDLHGARLFCDVLCCRVLVEDFPPRSRGERLSCRTADRGVWTPSRACFAYQITRRLAAGASCASRLAAGH